MESDKLELGLGLRRAAERDWATLPAVLLRGAAAFWWMVLGSLVGWTAMLLWHGGNDIGRIADLVGELALNTNGLDWAVISLTYLLVLLLALAAGWLGGQVRRVAVALRQRDA